MIDLENKRFWVTIRAGKGCGGNPVIWHSAGFVFMNFMKWKWFFEYVAAVYKIKNPRHRVQIETGSIIIVPPLEHRMMNLKNKITGAKAQITKWQNAVKLFENNWDQLFPYTDDPNYKKAKQKISKATMELSQLLLEMEDLKAAIPVE